MDFRKGDEEDVLKVCDVLIFMIKEDVIRAQNVQEYDGGYGFFGVQLTSKGLSLINAKAETSQISGSITETIKENSKAASSDTPYAKWGEFVGGLLGSLTNTLS